MDKQVAVVEEEDIRQVAVKVYKVIQVVLMGIIIMKTVVVEEEVWVLDLGRHALVVQE